MMYFGEVAGAKPSYFETNCRSACHSTQESHLRPNLTRRGHWIRNPTLSCCDSCLELHALPLHAVSYGPATGVRLVEEDVTVS